MNKGLLIIILLIQYFQAWTQKSYAAFDFGLESDRNRFNICLVGDTVLKSALSFYSSSTGGGIYKQLSFGSSGEILNAPEPYSSVPLYANELTFFREKGYLLYSDTLPSGQSAYPLHRVLDFVKYGEAEASWRIKGNLRAIGYPKSQIAKYSQSIWFYNLQENTLAQIAIASGDTLNELTEDLFFNQFPKNIKDNLERFTLNLINVNSDTSLFSILISDSSGFKSEPDYIIGEIDVNNLKVLNYHRVGNRSSVLFVDGFKGYMTHDYQVKNNLSQRSIVQMSINGDTLMKYPIIQRRVSPDTTISSGARTWFTILKRGDLSYYIESYQDTFWNRTSSRNHLRVIGYDQNEIVFDLSLKDSLGGYYDLKFDDAELSPEGNLVLSVGNRIEGSQGRLLFFKKTGENYFFNELNNATNYGLKMYPNISGQFVGFYCDSPIRLIQIATISGQEYLEFSPISESFTADISSLKSGLYIVRIKTENDQYIRKLIKAD
ncbi:T9SS type A sorting domain-containing protein [Croceimicrobium hydrocarbonivorans]|uniref:T9SS type A sorting domain-containing protein n=1 Tax=Croceimicrobium hydrocarbonivorans TaxID=2761580 RepID=A0A7H0VEX7_9FLAO|nr:T9SS type A sorting domain-containing protein [Croceimicrobium hydrocarbonivorans]QNR24275.1 T9SS type A sorting domain-containing protein [Croceimicrobium hydrocarbonivorans]